MSRITILVEAVEPPALVLDGPKIDVELDQDNASIALLPVIVQERIDGGTRLQFNLWLAGDAAFNVRLASFIEEN